MKILKSVMKVCDLFLVSTALLQIIVISNYRRSALKVSSIIQNFVSLRAHWKPNMTYVLDRYLERLIAESATFVECRNREVHPHILPKF